MWQNPTFAPNMARPIDRSSVRQIMIDALTTGSVHAVHGGLSITSLRTALSAVKRELQRERRPVVDAVRVYRDHSRPGEILIGVPSAASLRRKFTDLGTLPVGESALIRTAQSKLQSVLTGLYTYYSEPAWVELGVYPEWRVDPDPHGRYGFVVVTRLADNPNPNAALQAFTAKRIEQARAEMIEAGLDPDEPDAPMTE